jgi:hypothetical protein
MWQRTLVGWLLVAGSAAVFVVWAMLTSGFLSSDSIHVREALRLGGQFGGHSPTSGLGTPRLRAENRGPLTCVH